MRNTRKVRPREQNFGILQTSAEAKTGIARYVSMENERNVRPREQNFEVLQTSAEVEAGTACFLLL